MVRCKQPGPESASIPARNRKGSAAMPLYNVKAGVVELIDAPTSEAALSECLTRLRQAGFEPCEGEEAHHVFESEPLA